MTAPSKAMQGIRTVSVHYGIKWIADEAPDADRIMRNVYAHRSRGVANDPRLRRYHPKPRIDYGLAELMRQRVPRVTGNALVGKEKRRSIVFGNLLVIASPPRMYTEWRHDFLKSDLVVVGPRSREQEVRRRFRASEERSLRERLRVPGYLKVVRPLLDELFDSGLIIGVLGRGSYFCSNGLPEAHDNINFILLAKSSDEETAKRIEGVLRRIPRFMVEVVRKKTEPLKKGRHPSFDFTIVSEARLPKIKVGRYERYVLRDSIPIWLTRLSKRASEAAAMRFARQLRLR